MILESWVNFLTSCVSAAGPSPTLQTLIPSKKINLKLLRFRTRCSRISLLLMVLAALPRAIWCAGKD